MKRWLWFLTPLLLLFAAPTYAAKTQLGFDVSSYQDSSYQFMQNKVHQGAKFVIVKLGGSGGGEGYNYQNPKASTQLMNGQKAGLQVGGYYWGQFGGSVSQAKNYGQLAVNSAKKFGLRKGSFLALDYELGASYSKSNNTSAILTFMNKIKSNGYEPYLYSGAAYMRQYIDTSRVTKKYGDVLWVASYKTMSQQYKPDFNYFPSMNHVAIWQFADNWFNVDGNVEFLKHKTTKSIIKGKAKVNVVVTKTTKNKAKQQAKTYTVKSGDSWYSIALKFGMDMHQLAQLNGKTINSYIYPNDKVKLTGTLKKASKPVKQVSKKNTHDYKHVAKINYVAGHPTWSIRLLDNKGHYTNHYVRPTQRFKTYKAKKFSKGTAYLIGKNLWVLAKYTTVK